MIVAIQNASSEYLSLNEAGYIIKPGQTLPIKDSMKSPEVKGLIMYHYSNGKINLIDENGAVVKNIVEKEEGILIGEKEEFVLRAYDLGAHELNKILL